MKLFAEEDDLSGTVLRIARREVQPVPD